MHTRSYQLLWTLVIAAIMSTIRSMISIDFLNSKMQVYVFRFENIKSDKHNFQMMSNLKKTVRFFSKSTFSAAELQKARKDVDITQGLTKIGKTRFATHWTAAVALEKCLPQIQELLSDGIIKIKVLFAFDLQGLLICFSHSLQDKNVLNLFTARFAYYQFQLILVQYITIVAPLARSLWSLESSQANAADVFIFWPAIAATLNELFSRPPDVTGIDPALARKVTAIINRRYKAFIDESPSDIYFTAFFLDPREQFP